MKQVLVKSLHVTFFLVLLVAVLLKVDGIVERKASYTKYNDFFEQEQDFDVLFLGTSHVINGIFPMELWDEQGIVSYNLGNHAETMAETYWVLKNALDYTTPELVVIDLFSIDENYKVNAYDEQGNYDASLYLNRKAYLHNFMDSVTLSKNKYEAICDILPQEDRLEFLWDFTYYHSRWNELTQNDFSPESSGEKGADSRIGVTVSSAPEKIEDKQYNQEPCIAKDYLDKIIEMCHDREIEVLLIYLPYGSMPDEDQLNANYGYVVAEEKGINYINFIDTDIGINYTTDFYDSFSHLNPSGAKKITVFLGDYIIENYSIVNHKDDLEYEAWNIDFEEYMQSKVSKIVNQEKLNEYLMLLADDDFSCIYYLKEDSVLCTDEIVVELLKNLENGVTHIEGDKSNKALQIVDNLLGKKISIADTASYDTSFGTVEFDLNNRTLYLNESSENYLEWNGEKIPDLQVVVIRNDTGEVVDTKSFSIEEQVKIEK